MKKSPSNRQIIDDPYDPRKVLAHRDVLYKMLHGELTYPISIEVDPTDGRCNSRCNYCMYGSGEKKKSVYIDPQLLCGAVKTAQNHGTKAVLFVGGSEPTMHKDIAEISKSVLEMGLEVSMITNGILLDRIFPVASGFTFIRVSVDAGTAETYRKLKSVNCFDRVMYNIDQLTHQYAKDCDISLAYLCVPQNIQREEMRAFILNAIRVGVQSVAFRPVAQKEKWDPTVLREAITVISELDNEFSDRITIRSSVNTRWEATIGAPRKKSDLCLTRSLKAVICADGTVPLCHLQRLNTSSFIGNLYENSFDEIWEGERRKSLIQEDRVDWCKRSCQSVDMRNILDTYRNYIEGKESLSFDISKKAHPNIY